MLTRTKPWRAVVLAILLSWVAAVVLAGGALTAIGLFGGLDTSGGAIDWAAVAAVAAVISALATVALGAGLVMSAAQIEHERRRAADEQQRAAEEQRILRQPYIRADIGFDNHVNQPGFLRPVARYTYRLDDFAVIDGGTAPLATLGFPGGHPLVLWLQNMQRANLGVAIEVRVGLHVAWTAASGSQDEEFELRFRYLSPGQVTAVQLATVQPGIPSLVIRVTDIKYQDLLGNPLTGAHGAMSFVYAKGKEPLNERYADFRQTLNPAHERHEGDPEGTYS